MIRWILGRLIAAAIAVIDAFLRYMRRGASVYSDPDGTVISTLQRAGSDLTKPHPIEFFPYLPTEDGARRAADRFAADGYAATVQVGADNRSWLCLLTRSMVPDHAALLHARREFTVFAQQLGGEYDGWGTPIVAQE